MRILILDNDEEQRKFVRDNISSDDYELIEVENGQAALDILREKPIEILITEFEMPDFSAMDLVNNILSSNLEKFPFIILITDEETQNEAVDCLGPIPGDYIIKPLDPEGLRARVKVAERSISMQERLSRVRKESASLALYDKLTGVLNRQAIYDQALAEISRAQRGNIMVSVAMIEVANLTGVTEKHGSDIRDQALRYVASAIRANVRIYDILGRWMGAKFLLVLPNTSEENAAKVVERVNQSVSTIGIRLPDRKRLDVEVAIGVSSLPDEESMPLYVLVDQANEALKKAVEGESDKVVVYSGMK
ncbi:MAG: diguanylate cyclase [Chloroflexi bacterium]|nr:diguanylate cyclase [Chloroflexota bacterium]